MVLIKLKAASNLTPYHARREVSGIMHIHWYCGSWWWEAMCPIVLVYGIATLHAAAHATCSMDILSLILPLLPARWSPSMGHCPALASSMNACNNIIWVFTMWTGCGCVRIDLQMDSNTVTFRLLCNWTLNVYQVLYLTLAYSHSLFLSHSLTLTHSIILTNDIIKSHVYLCMGHCQVHIPVVHTCLSSKSWLMKQVWNAAT